jgi:hypothetical protein
MKTYTILFAQDIPHYGSVEIEAENDEAIIFKAKVYWRSVESGDEPWPLTEPDHDSAILTRIVQITDDHGSEVTTDISLDENYRLVNTRETGDAA